MCEASTVRPSESCLKPSDCDHTADYIMLTARTSTALLSPVTNRVTLVVSTERHYKEEAESLSALPTNSWSHLVLSFAVSPATQEFVYTLYLNGQLDRVFRVVDSPVTANDGPMRIGAHPATSGPRGYMSHSRLWRGALSSEAAAHEHSRMAAVFSSSSSSSSSSSGVRLSHRTAALHPAAFAVAATTAAIRSTAAATASSDTHVNIDVTSE
eukprot:15890-Heterococcus_DN1.PRE.5